MPDTPGSNVRKFRQSQAQQRSRIGGKKVPQSNEQLLKQKRRELSQLQRRRGSHRGDPDALKNHDERVASLRDEIRQLERR
jgi:hypothetical protein